MKKKTCIRKALCLLLIGSFLAATFSSCMSSQQMIDRLNGHFYKYIFAIRETTTRKKSTTYTNTSFTITFDPEYSRINFTITNHTQSSIKIIWNETYIKVQDDSSKVIHAEIPYSAKNKALQPSEIKAGGVLQDIIIPTDYIKNENGKWIERNFYPETDQSNSQNTDWIMGLLGVDVFKLYLPIQINRQTQVYTFTFYPIEMEKGAKSFKH